VVTIDGVKQILLLSGAGTTSVAPATGTLLWKISWPGDGIVQPAQTVDGDVLLGTGSGMVAPARGAPRRGRRGTDGWTALERWTHRV